MQRIPSAGTAISRAAAAEIPSRMHRPGRALAVLAALPMSTRPRMQTGIIAARLRSKAARILHSIKNLFRLRQLLHRRIPYSPPQKRWRAHSHKPRLLEMASSLTPRARQLCRPAPDVRRATWHRRTMQHPRQQKQRPGASYHPAGTVQSATDGRVTQNMQQEQAVHSQSESHPRSSASVQNHGGTVLSGTAGKTAGQNPSRTLFSRPAAQESRITVPTYRGRRYRPSLHNSAALLCSRLDAQRAPNGSCAKCNAEQSCFAVCHPRKTAYRQRRNTKPSEWRSGAKCASRIRSAAQHLCAGQTWQARSSRSSGFACFSAIRYGRKSVCATQQHAANSRAKRCSRKNSQILIPHPPAIAQELVRGRSNQAARRIRQRPVQAGTQRTSIGGRYTQPVQQTTRVSTNGNAQITQQNHVSAQQSNSMAQPSSGVRMDGRSTNREHPTPTMPVSPAPPSSNRETGTPPRSTARSDAARPAEQRASQRPIPAPSGSAEKSVSQTGTQLLPFPPHLPTGRAGNRLPQLLWAA